jgi:hypothetical protein
MMMNTSNNKLKIFIFLTLFVFVSNVDAAYCLIEDGNGNLSIDSTSVEVCPSGLVLLSKTDYNNMNVDLGEITSADIAISFTWGFGTYLSFWWFSYVIRTAKKTIKLI